MTLLTAPNVQPATVETDGGEPINLYKLGMLFVVKCRYWSCRAGNDPDDLDLSQDRIDAKAIASFGTKDLLDPVKTRKRFQQIEKKARHALEKLSRPFAAANAHFVPWNHVQAVIEQLEALRAEFDEAAQQFIADYPALRAEWQAQHPEIPDACYPLPMALPAKFGLSWHAFKVTGAPELTPVEDIEMELEQRRAREEQVTLMEANLKRECQQFVEQYVLGFRREVAEFCDQVVAQEGQVHGKTLNSIRDRIDRFHTMNVFGDGDAAGKLTQLKQQIAGLTGQDLAQQPDVAAKLSQACQALKNHILNQDAVSQLTGRLKRRVVLDRAPHAKTSYLLWCKAVGLIERWTILARLSANQPRPVGPNFRRVNTNAVRQGKRTASEGNDEPLRPIHQNTMRALCHESVLMARLP